MQRMRDLTITVPEYVIDNLALEESSSRRQRSGRPRPETDDPRWHGEAGYLFTVAASSRAIQGLRVPAVGGTRELACAVCLDDFKAGDELRTMPCSHSFHQRCIFRWLRISRLCPVCRFPLPSVEEQRVLDQDEEAAQAGSGSEATHDD